MERTKVLKMLDPYLRFLLYTYGDFWRDGREENWIVLVAGFRDAFDDAQR